MFGWIIRHHTLLSFALYTGGFVAFVLYLKKGLYSYQFQQYAWTHMILMVRSQGILEWDLFDFIMILVEWFMFAADRIDQ